MKVAAAVLTALASSLAGGGAGYYLGALPYNDRKERLRSKLIEKLGQISLPDFVPEDILDRIKTMPNEDVLKWAIEALNTAMENITAYMNFAKAILESLKYAFYIGE